MHLLLAGIRTFYHNGTDVQTNKADTAKAFVADRLSTSELTQDCCHGSLG